jgi:glutaminyl-tRNA synthetase
VLRAKIDMAHPNLNLRDPVMYRVRKTSHHRTGDRWCIYPMYDWAHGESDSIEGVTHSLCTLEYEDQRPLYDWYLEALGVYHPRQIEFARLSLSHTVMSKRKLLTLVQDGLVSGWDDPRMPTLAGLRRRGYTAASIRTSVTASASPRPPTCGGRALEHCLREDLNRAPGAWRLRRCARGRELPGGTGRGGGQQPEDPEPDRARSPRACCGSSRTTSARRPAHTSASHPAWMRGCARPTRSCTGLTKDPARRVTEVPAPTTPRPAGRGQGRKIKSTIHWVSAAHAIEAEVRLYDTPSRS